MKALLFERSLPKFAAARVAGARFGPLHLADVDEPELPGPEWQRVRPRLAGICGSDLATVAGRSSRWFEPIVSFPFTPGHEVVGDLDDGSRVVIEPVLTCAPRGLPLCEGCRGGRRNRCESIAAGHLEPGLQIGYCADTGGGWGLALVAHQSQLHRVPGDLADEAAVMVEPAACAVHAARQAVPARPTTQAGGAGIVVVIGAGTLGLCTIAAVSAIAHPEELIAVAKHPEQRKLAGDLGATTVCEPGELTRAVRRATGSLMIGAHVAGGASVVIDCVGTAESLAQALAVIKPGGMISLVGMPGHIGLDLTPLWQREISLIGCYAYTTDDFDEAFRLVRDAQLDRLVSAVYPLDRFRDAIQHATDAGRRGAVKIAFDLRQEKHR
jgi:threonine dehydrogenase-like Zn-dependent dehydrogenase